MGFTEIDTLVPLLEKFVKKTVAAATVENSEDRDSIVAQESTSAEKLRVAQGLQQVLAVLLGTRVTEVYI